MFSKQLQRGRELMGSTLRRMAKDAASLLLGSVGGAILGLIALVITTQSLGPTKFGSLVLATTYVAIVGTLLNFQPWQALIKFGAEYMVAEDDEGFRGLVRFSFLLDLLTATLGAAFGFLLAGPIGQLFGWSSAVATLAGWYSFSVLFHVIGAPTGVLRLFDEYRALALFAFGASALRLVGVSVVAATEPSLEAFAAAWFVASVLADLVLLAYSLRVLRREGHGSWWKARMVEWRRPLRFAVLNNLTSTLALPITQFDVVLTASVISVEATGIYKVMKQVASVFGKLADPIYQVAYPEFAKAIAQNEVQRAKRLCFKIGGLILGLLSPVTLIAVLTSAWWFPWVFGDDFSAGATALNVFLVLKLVSVTLVTVHPLFLALGHAGWNTIIQFFANSSYMVIAWWLGIRYGLTGIVLAYGASLVAVAGPKLLIILRARQAG